jgi:hypothetical protein
MNLKGTLARAFITDLLRKYANKDKLGHGFAIKARVVLRVILVQLVFYTLK